MYKQPNYEKLSIFLSKENPEEYDFKYEDNLEDENPIKRFLKYKLNYNINGKFDCDRSELAMSLQIVLLQSIGAKVEGYSGREIKYKIKNEEQEIEEVVETDTINSLWATYRNMLLEEDKKYWDNKAKDYEEKNGKKITYKPRYEWLLDTEVFNHYTKTNCNKELIRCAQLTGSIGNFNIGPVGFNFSDKKNSKGTRKNGDKLDKFLKSLCQNNDLKQWKEWFDSNIGNTFLEMYFKENGVIKNLEEGTLQEQITLINELIIQRGKEVIQRLMDRHFIYDLGGSKIFMWPNEKDKEMCVYVVDNNNVYIVDINNPPLNNINNLKDEDKIINFIVKNRSILKKIWMQFRGLRTNRTINPISETMSVLNESFEEFEIMDKRSEEEIIKEAIQRLMDRHFIYDLDGSKIFMWPDEKDKEMYVYVVDNNNVYIVEINSPHINNINNLKNKDKIIGFIMENRYILKKIWMIIRCLRINRTINPISETMLALNESFEEFEIIKDRKRRREMIRAMKMNQKERWISECGKFSVIVSKYDKSEGVLNNVNYEENMKLTLKTETLDLIQLLREIRNNSIVRENDIFNIEESELNFVYIKRKDGRGGIKLQKKSHIPNLINFLDKVGRGCYYF